MQRVDCTAVVRVFNSLGVNVSGGVVGGAAASSYTLMTASAASSTTPYNLLQRRKAFCNAMHMALQLSATCSVKLSLKQSCYFTQRLRPDYCCTQATCGVAR